MKKWRLVNIIVITLILSTACGNNTQRVTQGGKLEVTKPNSVAATNANKEPALTVIGLPVPALKTEAKKPAERIVGKFEPKEKAI